MELLFVDALEHKEEIADLLEEYTGLLVSLNPGFSKYLDEQDFSHELEDPGLKYGHEGRLFVVLCDGEVAGCVGFKHLDASSCELKRMYLRPAFRKKHLAARSCLKSASRKQKRWGMNLCISIPLKSWKAQSTYIGSMDLRK